VHIARRAGSVAKQPSFIELVAGFALIAGIDASIKPVKANFVIIDTSRLLNITNYLLEKN
jgi:hypothetical protein